MKPLLAILALMFLTGCTSCVGNKQAADPTERGCTYIAGAIVFSAIIRALFNK